MGPFDLHVLSTPPAFILSQDQTLMLKFDLAPVKPANLSAIFITDTIKTFGFHSAYGHATCHECRHRTIPIYFKGLSVLFEHVL